MPNLNEFLNAVRGVKSEMLVLDDVYPAQHKFAPVCPAHIYKSMALNGYVPRTVLLLAHDVVAQSYDYAEVFSSPAFNDTTIIMDNSVAELGNAVDMDMVYEAAETVSADYVILPDVYGSGVGTFEAIEAIWPKWQRKFHDYKSVPVLHGNSMEDWHTAAYAISKILKPEMISIPRKLEIDCIDNRINFVEMARMYFRDTPVHLLGFSDTPWWDIFSASHSNVVSIDSAVPLRVDYSQKPLTTSAGKRGSWWTDVEYETWMIDSCRKIDTMISRMR